MEGRLLHAVFSQYVALSEMMHLPITGIVGGTSFEQLVAATSPVAWYDFQDTNFNTGTSLQDRSGNNWDIPRVGASNIPAGPAFTSKKTKSASMTSSTAQYWNDTPSNLDQYIDGQSSFTLTFTYAHADLTANFCKILGWRSSNSTCALAAYTQFGGGTSITCTVSNSGGIEYESFAGCNDTLAHIFTIRVNGTQVRCTKDGVLFGSPTMATGTIFTTSAEFQVGGTHASGNAQAFFMDHIHMNNYVVLDANIVAMHNAFLAERL
jgi:hypothetical protein